MTPSFNVPAQYFYALTANLPIDVDADVRYRMAVSSSPKRIVDDLHTAIDAGVISAALPITPEQAARRLDALGSDAGGGPICNPNVGWLLLTPLTPLGGWLGYVNPAPTDDPEVDIAPFWSKVLAPLGTMSLTHPALAKGHMELVVCAIIKEGDPSLLLAALQAEGSTLLSVKDLDPQAFAGAGGITFAQWKQVFQNHPGAIPLFASVGVNTASPEVALTEQTSAFVRRLSQFFNLPAVATPVPSPGASALPELVKPDSLHDLMALFVLAYIAQPGHAAFAFGQTPALDPAAAHAAAALVLPTDPGAAAWLIEAASKVNALYWVADVAGVTDELRFSIAEALHARGFVSVDSIAALTPDDFQDALIGTVAYPYAQQIQAKAGSAASPATPPAGPFGPINDGTLTNCVPPPWLSPLGPVAYLHDLWTLSEAATCESPGGDGKAPTLGDTVAKRRGPLGDLLATQANLETGLPMVDLVNECLEQLVAGGSVSAVYQTSGTALAGHLLARPDAESNDSAIPFRHDPERLFAALPEHSSPGAGLAAADVKLRDDFSAPVLPYSQPLDVNRSYLHELRTSRFATMRRFRKDITEFVLDPDPAHQPADFASHQWRYPVRVDIAREYLGITPEEYTEIFTTDLDPALLAELYGFAPGTPSWMVTVTRLSELLPRTGLTYCELIELWRSGFVVFEHRAATREKEDKGFPLCEPCYLDKHAVIFKDPAKSLAQLIVFIRLWQKLSRVHGAGYTFTQLADIAAVLGLFTSGGAINPDFIRQLAAFQMLRDDFGLPLVDERDPTPGTGAERTHLLALFVMPPSGVPVPRKWSWAIGRLIDRIGHHARSEHHAEARLSEFIKMLASNLDPLSRVAGFDPLTADRTWHALPTHALRFAEVLSKIYASRFGVGEILFLFTVDDALEGDDPFRLPSEEESLDSPLDLPDDGGALSLWSLRRALRDVDQSDEDVHAWTWPRIERSLREDFGFTIPTLGADPVLELGRHFFPEHLEHTGTTAAPKDRRYRQALLAADTSPAMWNAPGDGPFHYDAGAQELWAAIPLKDESVLEKLSRIRQLSTNESKVLRELYFLPRVDLARFAFLFVSFDEAVQSLIEEADEHRRWAYFQRSFARCHARCKLIAKHLAEHVSAAAGEHDRHEEHRHDHDHLAWRILKQLLADENAPKPLAPWESDAGKPPVAVTWPHPTGSAFAAILGLLGTGLLGELRHEGSSNVLWRELRGPMDPFGRVLNHWNVPVPTVLPALNAALSPAQAGFADVRNGILIANSGVRPLGGAEGYCARWTGVLLVDEAGPHQFFAGAPMADGERPDVARAQGMRWRVTLRRGQKSWIVLARGWPNEEDCGDRSSHLPLKRGAYTIDIELIRCAPDYPDADDAHPLHSGFELAYVGPDTDGRTVPLPHHRLFLEQKTGTLGDHLDERVQGAAKLFLDTRYVSTLRDVRRTYQRAFKALLLARRFELSARMFADYGQSEIGYLLDYPDRFQGTSFYSKAGAWQTHRAWFDLDFLPIRDPYHPPAGDDRASPSVPRQQALFDGWERVFDYTALRRHAKARASREIWLLFDDSSDSPTQDPKQLVHYMGINATFAPLVLTFDVGYPVVAADLQDERWLVRVWRAEAWVRRLEAAFLFKDLREARPDLWASDDPSVSGGNDNLTKVFQNGCIENGPPRRYADLKRLNDGLRERARQAMIAYLCGPSGGTGARSAKQLSELLLIDVEVGLCERASRIEEGVTSVQLFERRSRLGLEPAWSPSPGFALLRDRSFATFHTWQACERKHLYRENWIEWSELEGARRTEGFRFLESELRRGSLTVPVPGGLTYWDGARPPAHPGLQLLQAREPATIELVPTQPEALNLLGTPERSARRSWLASVAGVVKPPPRDPTGGQDHPRLAAGGVTVGAPLPPRAATVTGKLPLWIESAIRLGVRFLRVAAAGVPPASNAFSPRGEGGEAGCCVACGQRHEAVADEYYFWLVDSRYFSTDDARQDASSNWDDDPGAKREDLPKLLSWTSKPSVHLMWSLMHDGQLQQPRRATAGVPVKATAKSWTLELTGRKADSLYFKVNGAEDAAAGLAKTPEVGFRYDLATDSAVTVPEVAPDPTVPFSIGGLLAYPYFAYFEPGAPLAPLSMFSESVAVACVLRSHCRFEAALRWYEAFFSPLTHDTRWCWESIPRLPPDLTHGDGRLNLAPVGAETAPPRLVSPAPGTLTPAPIERAREGMCCRFSFVTDDVARRRAITLDYVETLLEWGDAIMRRNAPEAFQQARLVFDTASKILGPRPSTVLDEATLLSPTPPTVATYNAAVIGVPLNPRLLALYDCAVDRLASIHACLDDRRRRNGQSSEDMPYWGTDARRRRWAADHVCSAGCGHEEICADEGDWCDLPSPYRFTFLTQKALGLAGEVRSFGASLLSAFEKGDAEHVAYVRASHERQLVELTLAIREDAWRAADWDVQALKKSKELAQNQLQYYVGLIAAGLNSGENDYVGLTNGSIAALTAATVSETIGTILGVIPDVFVGTTSFVQLPIGSKLAGVFNGIGQIAHTTSAILSTTAGLRMTQSGWERRDAEWHHQVDVFTIEIEQIERQILAAQRRRDSAAHELDNTRRQIEQSREMLDLLRDKFTSQELYLYLQKETAALHRQTYELALRAARQAQRAFNFERGYSSRQFIPGEIWQDLREGLLAGERLSLALQRMEKAYCDENVREYELTKHISLRQLFPAQFLRLKTTGRCEIEIPEWLFDLDYPGQYLRRIKNVALTIPCVVGPYTGVHCRLTLLASTTRVLPTLLEPIAACCKDAPPREPLPASPCGCWSEPLRARDAKEADHASVDSGYAARPDDPRIVRRYGAKEAIATSSGQNDPGLFQLDFHDERYLPFEFEGAVSRFRIELPPENNYFDMDTLNDVVLHLNYTAREGGEVLRKAASLDAQRHVPDAGHRVFDVRQELSDAWRRFQAERVEDSARRGLELRIGRDMFMFLPGHRDVSVTRLEVFFEAPDAEPGRHREIEICTGHRRGCKHAERDDVREVDCVASAEWPGFYRGVLDIHVGPLSWREHDLIGTLRFHPSHGIVREVYVVCSYETTMRPTGQAHSPERRLHSGHMR